VAGAPCPSVRTLASSSAEVLRGRNCGSARPRCRARASRLRLEYGSWNTPARGGACCAASGWKNRRIRGPSAPPGRQLTSSSRRMARPTVDLPQPDSPTRDKVSARAPRRTRRPRHRKGLAAEHAPRTGKCFLRSLTWSSAGHSCRDRRFRRVMANGDVAGRFLFEIRAQPYGQEIGHQRTRRQDQPRCVASRLGTLPGDFGEAPSPR